MMWCVTRAARRGYVVREAIHDGDARVAACRTPPPHRHGQPMRPMAADMSVASSAAPPIGPYLGADDPSRLFPRAQPVPSVTTSRSSRNSTSCSRATQSSWSAPVAQRVMPRCSTRCTAYPCSSTSPRPCRTSSCRRCSTKRTPGDSTAMRQRLLRRDAVRRRHRRSHRALPAEDLATVHRLV